MSFRIGLVEYPEGEYPVHKHNQYEIIAYQGSTGCFHTPDCKISIRDGDIVIVPPGVMHGMLGDKGLYSIAVSGELDSVFCLETPVMITDGEEREGRALATMIYQERYGDPEYIAALVNAYTHYILKHLKLEDRRVAAVQKVIHQIRQRFCDSSLELREVLCETGYAEDYIRAQFKRVTGMTPNGFLTDIRIRHACYLIDVYRNVLNLSEIAERCGYTDYVYFSRKFKQVKGVSPRRYQESV